MKIAVLGYGTVGGGVVAGMDTNQKEIAAAAHEGLEVKYILDLRSFPGDPYEQRVVHDYSVILNDPEIKIIAETMGGTEPARTFTEQALQKGISVVTSNKELVDAHGAALVATAKANHCSYLFEASVGGGIPILNTLHTALASEQIESVTGILNGTTNYILTKMEAVGADFADVLKKAQDLGYAEKDPAADVEGFDPCRKIAILASIVSDSRVSYEDILTEGITKVTRDDFRYARYMERRMKLLGHMKRRQDGALRVIVAPFLIPLTHPLSGVDDVFNAIQVSSNLLGVSMYYGRGAGRDATAAAVIADICEIARAKGAYIPRNLQEAPAVLIPASEQTYRFFLRVEEGKLQAMIQALQARNVVTEDLQRQFDFHVEGERALVAGPVSLQTLEEAADAAGGMKTRIRLLDL